ncbi:aconitate hydratase [Gluconacetobacter sacchari DSM 12717]|uniref:aconitate hydratase n=2 Tax=Gluconacetobacter sacchari TaxID=92759 RepID=A0A7W4IAD8_9PROT|nr:aconitate hydratase AcnA [Gluconacetobacter sacchari]MBB2159231.1 aconitate hydratase AcnA [Gluconacetobacter sacchari]GBQ22115.1 aconitate hydratase [Gluconacetobacter sacchari DSM 12717]
MKRSYWTDTTPRQIDPAAIAVRLGTPPDALPFSARILLENVARQALLADGDHLADSTLADLVAIVRRAPADRGRGVALAVSRVILPDSSGVPVLQNLAGMRDIVAARGGDVRAVSPSVPLDLIVDHSLQVDISGAPDALVRNLAREYERNTERYAFLKWARQAMAGLTLHPPGSGIIHQINLERLARIMVETPALAGTVVHPEFVLGGDSHTPMVNALGVLGWGVGGLDIEAALLGQPYVVPVPEIVGALLDGTPPPGVMTTDLALLVTETLRRAGVAGAFVEFFGPGIRHLRLEERATLANMAPEYGATCGFFPVDEETCRYMAATRGDAPDLEARARRGGVFRSLATPAPAPDYDRVIRIDLSTLGRSIAGPSRPEQRLPLAEAARSFHALKDEEDGRPRQADAIADGAVAIAAIASCTNTANPAVMLAAGLVAAKAVARGMRVPPWVKTSMTPGSPSVKALLERASLLAPLETLGFAIAGYGCTTCGGKSGPLLPAMERAIERHGVRAVAVLSGNRNFEGRIHRLLPANYLASPPLVVLFALAGRVDLDLETDPIGHDSAGTAVHLRDLWPTPEELAGALGDHAGRGPPGEAPEESRRLWNALAAPGGDTYPWRPNSAYLCRPRLGAQNGADWSADRLGGARVLAAFGDSLTTDHISPSGEIPPDSPAGRYLSGLGIPHAAFNTYVARRGNPEVMARATFANIRIRNALAGNGKGWETPGPDGTLQTIHDAAMAWRARDVPLIVLGGHRYGTGSSRDWAARGTAMLGVRIVIARDFERIHRSNLVGMGVLPLLFADGESWPTLGLTGLETFSFHGLRAGIEDGAPITVEAMGATGTRRFVAHAALLTDSERALLRQGGIHEALLAAVAPPARPQHEADDHAG